ncbi:MAG: hypothetical protein Q9160_008293 [Pyrenula sp. 1 TL-2023]
MSEPCNGPFLDLGTTTSRSTQTIDTAKGPKSGLYVVFITDSPNNFEMKQIGTRYKPGVFLNAAQSSDIIPKLPSLPDVSSFLSEHRIGTICHTSLTPFSIQYHSQSNAADRIQPFEEEVQATKPQFVCVIGKMMWDQIFLAKTRHPRFRHESFSYGWQGCTEHKWCSKNSNFGASLDDGWPGPKMFVLPHARAESSVRDKFFGEFGHWMQTRNSTYIPSTRALDGNDTNVTFTKDPPLVDNEPVETEAVARHQDPSISQNDVNLGQLAAEDSILPQDDADIGELKAKHFPYTDPGFEHAGELPG